MSRIVFPSINIPAFKTLSLWSNQSSLPTTGTYATATNVSLVNSDSDFGECLELLKLSTTDRLRWINPITIGYGRYYRLTVRLKQISGQLGSARLNSFLVDTNNAHASSVTSAGETQYISSLSDIITLSLVFGKGARPENDMILADPVSGAYIGLDILGTSNSVFRIENMSIEDVSSEMDYSDRTSVNAADLAAMYTDGSVISMGSLHYLKDNSALGTQSATYDLGVSKLRPYGQASLAHFGVEAGTNQNVGDRIQQALTISRDLYFPEGVYKIDNVELTPQNGAFLRGPGTLLKTLSKSGFTSDYISVLNRSNVTIDGLSFSGPTCREYGVRIENASYITVQNCKFNDATISSGKGCVGVRIFKNSKYINIQHNIFYGGLSAISTGGDKTGNVNGHVTNVEIAHNYIENCDTEAIDINWDTQNCIISDNQIKNCGVYQAGNEAIDVGGGAYPHNCSRIQVLNNVIEVNKTGESGVLFKLDTTNSLVSGNIIHHLGDDSQSCYGIRVENSSAIKIHANEVIGFRYSFITGKTVKNLTISQNTFMRPRYTACQITAASNEGLIIEANLCDGQSIASSYGTRIYKTTTSTIRGNIIKGFIQEDGIIAENSCTQLTISQNLISDCDTGIFLLAPNSLASENKVTECRNEGIRVQAPDAQLANNSVLNCAKTNSGKYGLTIASSHRSIITGNYMADNRSSKRQNGIYFIPTSTNCIVSSNLVGPINSSAAKGLTNVSGEIIGNIWGA